MTFIGRTRELELLKRELNRPRPSLLVIYGRRRVGKSTLILESLHEQRFVYYQASRVTDDDNLNLFKQNLETGLGADPILASLTDWSGIFAYLATLASKQAGLSVVLDEFPYLCEANSALPSLLQAAWDRIRVANPHFNLILCGSSIGFMEDLLAERNPLRGRQTLTLDLEPMNYREIALWVKDWQVEEQIMLASILGGMPYYLSFLDPNLSLKENLFEIVLTRGAPLFDEPALLLQAELQAPQRYASILRAISDGCHEWGEILGRVKDFKDGSQLAPYIKKLEQLRLLEIKKSFGVPEKDRNRRYDLSDPFLRFWYRFVLPNRSALEAGHASSVFDLAIEPHLNEFMGAAFERICRDYTKRFIQEQLGIPTKEVGQIWAADYDLDVTGELLDGSRLYGECKWWQDRVGENILERLLETSKQAEQNPKNPKYLLFSRNGFTPSLIQRAQDTTQLHLISLSNLMGKSADLKKVKIKRVVKKKKLKNSSLSE